MQRPQVGYVDEGLAKVGTGNAPVRCARVAQVGQYDGGAGEIVDAKGEVKKLRTREEILKARQAERDAAPKLPEYNVKMGPRVTEDLLKKSDMEMAERAMEAARQRRRSDR